MILAILASFYITWVLVYAAGPYDLFARLRGLPVVYKSGVLECFPCATFWVSLIVAPVVADGISILFFALSIAGATLLLDKIVLRITR